MTFGRFPLGGYLRRPPLRLQLTALYSGLVLGVVAAILFATGVLYKHQAGVAPGIAARHGAGTGGRIASAATAGSRTFDIGPALIGLAAVAVAVALAWWLAGRLLRPLRTITTTAQEISATDLHRRLALDGPDDELTALGRTLDDLFACLEASFEAQRHFVANASHELRTPLAGQRTLLQVALADPGASAGDLRDACEEALALGEQQERLINALLTLAAGEKGVEQRETFDLTDITAALLAAHQQDADRRGITIHRSFESAPVTGERSLIERLTANLLDNAIRHNIPNGTITISTSRVNAGAQFSISNSGPVISPTDLPRLVEPFERVGTARTRNADGHGLGLAIVKAIADAHGASLTLTPRVEGGLEVIAAFPSVGHA